MSKKFPAYLLTALIYIFCTASFIFASDASVILAELNRLKIKVIGSIQPQDSEFPAEFNGPYWGLLANVCKQGGYNLDAYAGKKAKIVNLPVNNPARTLNVVAFSCDEKIVCVYFVDSTTVPGMEPVVNSKK